MATTTSDLCKRICRLIPLSTSGTVITGSVPSEDEGEIGGIAETRLLNHRQMSCTQPSDLDETNPCSCPDWEIASS